MAAFVVNVFHITFILLTFVLMKISLIHFLDVDYPYQFDRLIHMVKGQELFRHYLLNNTWV